LVEERVFSEVPLHHRCRPIAPTERPVQGLSREAIDRQVSQRCAADRSVRIRGPRRVTLHHLWWLAALQHREAEERLHGFIPFADGTTFKEITPKGYVEGAFMFMKDGKYYLMWSEGGWTGPDYAVAYAIASSPFGPFNRVGKILQQDVSVATGAGHHSVLHAPGSNKWYIVHHRRPLGETDRNHRVVCIDEMRFDEQGLITPVAITKDGVPRDVLR
jgi:hypothetical protein